MGNQIRQLQNLIVELGSEISAIEEQLDNLEAAFVHQSKGFEVVIDTEHEGDIQYTLLNKVKRSY